MKKLSASVLAIILLAGCATANRDNFYSTIGQFMQQSQACYIQTKDFTNCTIPTMKATIEPAWKQYAGDDDIFPNYYRQLEAIQKQRDSRAIDEKTADLYYHQALNAFVTAIRLRDEAVMGQQRRIAAALSAFSSGYNRNNAAPIQESAMRGSTIYRADECVGPVIMGECKGSIIDKGGNHPTCHGQWLGGQCTGPMF